jgi:hypothetical protein
MIQRRLKVSLSQQLEEARLRLSELEGRGFRDRDKATWRMSVERMRAIVTTISFLFDHREDFIRLVEEKRPEELRKD